MQLASSMFLFAIQSEVPYLLNTFASNATTLTPKSKLLIATINQTSFIETINIVQERK
jgi:hypothetical protein